MYVLYLDKLNAKMEQMFLDHMPKRDDVEVHFLNPVNGEPGELSKADILIDTTFQVTSDVLKEASNCKLIQRTGIGLDMVDVSCAKSKNWSMHFYGNRVTYDSRTGYSGRSCKFYRKNV